MSFRSKISFPFLGLLCSIFLLAAVTDGSHVRAQPTKKVRVEEEESAPEKTRVPKKIEEIQPQENPASRERPAPVEGKFDIAREANKIANPFVRILLLRITIPYDELMPVWECANDPDRLAA